MTVLKTLILLMVAAGGLGVVLTRDPLCQAVAVSFYGILVALMFFIFQAPDAALLAAHDWRGGAAVDDAAGAGQDQEERR